jgi:ABC-type transport system involved in multi-copper enzyme maturation permease subunit
MKSIWIIAKNTYREIIRDRILYGIIVFALMLVGLSLALGQLTFAEQAKISADFGFAGIQLSAVVLAIFVGSSLVAKEIEKQTILTLLARPISRSQFLLGKFFGLSLVILTVMFGLALVLGLVVHSLELAVNGSFALALYGILLEAMLLLSLTLLFGSFSRPIMTVIFVVSFFLLGHWVGSLRFFVEKSDSNTFKTAGTFITWIIPDLERFNWRSVPIYQTVISGSEVLKSTGYALGWILVMVALTTVIFRKRDFV